MPPLPAQIGKYSIVERIGKGGMGMVYKARHPTLDRFVILKKLTIAGDTGLRERFRREAEIMIDFRTDYVVDVYDHFREGGNDYIVLEYIDGKSLDELIESERYLSNNLALYVIRSCCYGLRYVHSKGVIHRDVKPGNVIAGRDGSIRLLDFGIASRGLDGGDDLTREGVTLGTVAYIPPEQIAHSRTVDTRADIYALGATLYELVTGRKAFTGGFTPETVSRIQRGRYRNPRRVNPQVSGLTARIIRRCMRRNPRRRYQTVQTIIDELDRYFTPRKHRAAEVELGRLLETAPPKTSAIPRPKRRWGRWALAAAGMILVTCGAMVATETLQQWLLSESHGSVRFQIRVRNGLYDVADSGLTLSLTPADAAEELPTLPLLRPVDNLATPDYTVLRTRRLYRPAGTYLATTSIQGTIFQEVIVLAADQDRTVEVLWDPRAETSVSIDVRCYDAGSGVAIESGMLILISADEGSWLPWNPDRDSSAGRASRDPSPEVDIRSLAAMIFGRAQAAPQVPTVTPGQSIRVRIVHPQYQTAETTVTTDRHTRAIVVALGLKEKP